MPKPSDDPSTRILTLLEDTVAGALGFAKGYVAAVVVALRDPLRASAVQSADAHAGPLTFLVTSALIATQLSSHLPELIDNREAFGLFVRDLQNVLANPSAARLVAQVALLLVGAHIAGRLLIFCLGRRAEGATPMAMSASVHYLLGVQLLMAAVVLPLGLPVFFLIVILARLDPWGDTASHLTYATFLSWPVLCLAKKLRRLDTRNQVARFWLITLPSVALASCIGLGSYYLGVYAREFTAPRERPLYGTLLGLTENDATLVLRNNTGSALVLDTLGGLTPHGADSVSFNISPRDEADAVVVLEKDTTRALNLSFEELLKSGPNDENRTYHLALSCPAGGFGPVPELKVLRLRCEGDGECFLQN
jgi:hypothetical protein